MEEVNKYWDAYNSFKETAEQHDFIRLLMLDSQLIPAYNDLKENYCEEHAEIFIRGMKKVLASLGITLHGEEGE